MYEVRQGHFQGLKLIDSGSTSDNFAPQKANHVAHVQYTMYVVLCIVSDGYQGVRIEDGHGYSICQDKVLWATALVSKVNTHVLVNITVVHVHVLRTLTPTQFLGIYVQVYTQ